LAYVQFYNHGYEYFNEKDDPLFSSDSTHSLLFQYAAEDLSCLPGLLHQYISQKMDLTTFEPKDTSDSSGLEQITKTLRSIHPYYEHEYKKTVIKAVGDYFYHLLTHAAFSNKKDICTARNAEWYYKRITGLLPSSWFTEDDFYQTYKTWAVKLEQASDEPEKQLRRQLPDTAAAFSEVINTQYHVYNMLFFLLDISANDLNTLTTAQRIWLFDRIFHESSGQMCIHTADRLSFQPTAQGRGHRPENGCGTANIFKPLHSLNGLNIRRDGIPPELAACFHTAVEYAKQITSPNAYETYKINSLRQLLDLEILSMIQTETMIRKCNSCGKYFVVSSRRTAYCNRVNASGVSCSAVGSKQSFQRKLENDEALRIYNRAYKTHHARIRSGKMKENHFSLWRMEAKEMLERVRAGELELGDFKKWVKY